MRRENLLKKARRRREDRLQIAGRNSRMEKETQRWNPEHSRVYIRSLD